MPSVGTPVEGFNVAARAASGLTASFSGEHTSEGNVSRAFLDKMVREYHTSARDNPDMAVATVAIKSLTSLIVESSATTMMGLEKEIKEAAAALQMCNPSSISLKAGCELFLRYTTRTSAIENEDFKVAKARLIERGDQFAEKSTRARQAIADVGARFLVDGQTVLVHGYSRVVLAILQRAAAAGAHLKVVVTDGRPSESGLKMAKALSACHVPVQIIMDTAVAYKMDTIDMVLVGAEAVVESGGVINCLGTYQVALCAQVHSKPFYVAAESYKFARLFPLHQRDLRHDRIALLDVLPLVPAGVVLEPLSRDYTPPQFISLLITDLGVLTPAAVSDELIQLYI